MPRCDLYDGSGDPREHVYQFQTNMMLLQVSDAVMCRAFLITLRKAAHEWFKSLQPRFIYSFAQLSDLLQKHFASSRTRKKNSASLLNVVQEKTESWSHYLGWFNVVMLEIDNLDEDDSLRGGRNSKRSRRDDRLPKELFNMKNLTSLNAQPS
ncbi:hypothetical protein RJ639_035618 [Escallonia herrerae]|uniref:Retrotransposon gag domain-containing protein n=1 Tax=Escallonia herrerae TaxID=1293975 RepID=A0AA88WQF2_9ASTE|nr:hypothetical protein RJ639_035618 [Escallonia herrerae]